jgi:NDP-sugar pyrophosphorylase family protein
MTDYFVHESSYVDEGAEIGAGTRIWHFCHVMPGAVIGERCNLGQNVVVMPTGQRWSGEAVRSGRMRRSCAESPWESTASSEQARWSPVTCRTMP